MHTNAKQRKQQPNLTCQNGLSQNLGNLMRLHGNSPEPRVLQASGEIRRHLPLPKRRCNFILSKQLSPFLVRLELPYPDGEILSGCDENVSFTRDRFTSWVKADPHDTLELHVVNVRKALSEYREASVRRHDAPAPAFFFDSMPKRSSVQKTSTTGVQDLNVEKRTLSRNNVQGNGILSHCRRRLSMLTSGPPNAHLGDSKVFKESYRNALRVAIQEALSIDPRRSERGRKLLFVLLRMLLF